MNNDTQPYSTSFSTLCSIGEHLKRVTYPQLFRPALGPSLSPTIELVRWGIQAYCLPWVRHFGTLINGIVLLSDADNKAAVRIIGRSSYELCAHAYYVKKHIKQHIDSGDLNGAWNFLLPVTTGSRYINEYHPHGPEDNAMFPSPPHVKKAINCFKEVMPDESGEDYSYLSEFCHPNMMAFTQHYHWKTPYIIEFGDQVEFGAFGAIAGSALNGLLAIHELLAIGHETEIKRLILGLLTTIADQAQKDLPPTVNATHA